MTTHDLMNIGYSAITQVIYTMNFVTGEDHGVLQVDAKARHEW